MKPIERSLENLTAKEKSELSKKGWRDRRLNEFPPCSKDCRPSDYFDYFSRGSIEFNPDLFNYSFHKVLIPNGTVIQPNEKDRRYNFSQIQPLTDCIIRNGEYGHNLKFVSCNLSNVKTYPDWTIQGGNNSQYWLIEEEDLDSVNGKRFSHRKIASSSQEAALMTINRPQNAKTAE